MQYSRTGGKDAGDFASYTVDFNFDTYLSQPLVKYSGNNAAGREQIVTQKYLAFFMNSGMEAYFNYRRTGFPKFMTGVGTGNSRRIALRSQQACFILEILYNIIPNSACRFTSFCPARCRVVKDIWRIS